MAIRCVSFGWRERLKYPADSTGQDTRAEEDVEAPLELMATVVHVDEIYGSFLRSVQIPII